LADTAVVLVSAGFPRGVQLQIEPPADAYIRKPFDVSAVEAVLEQLVCEEQLA
jgi:hypothetical protein